MKGGHVYNWDYLTRVGEGVGNSTSILTASVFPEPVCAIPTMSRPLIAMGQPCAWIEVGLLNPDFLKF